MLEKCHKYSVAINAKGRPFPTEPLIMALLLEQHKMINWLQEKIPIPKQRFFECSWDLMAREYKEKIRTKENWWLVYVGIYYCDR
jgi:hypothetical protein